MGFCLVRPLRRLVEQQLDWVEPLSSFQCPNFPNSVHYKEILDSHTYTRKPRQGCGSQLALLDTADPRAFRYGVWGTGSIIREQGHKRQMLQEGPVLKHA